MLAGIIVAGAGTGEIAPAFSVGGYLYGIHPVIALVLGLPAIGSGFPQIDDIVHKPIFLPSLSKNFL
jgi:hypothetical protein